MTSKSTAKSRKGATRGKKLVAGKKMSDVKPLAFNAYVQITSGPEGDPPPPPKG
jgi:hypothetical protein